MFHSFSERAVAGRVFRADRSAGSALVLLMILFPCLLPTRVQSQTGTASTDAPGKALTNEGLQQRVGELESEVAELKRIVKELQSSSPPSGAQSVPNAQLTSVAQPESVSVEPATITPQDRKSLDFLRDTTINIGLDGYYEYNFNAPVGRVNLLRAYDVLSNSFSLNQASVIFERLPDVADGHRFGGRLDLQFGQATDTLQGNPTNEPRPDIYRNIFQAYGTYVVPLGHGLNVDFGKFASSIGIEGNYTKDQMNYSRSYWFNFLPFYHMGFRVSYPVNDKFALNYWLINGTNQVEPTNSFIDELFGFTATPRKTISWTTSYYFGQEHPDRISVPPTSPIPVQPGLSFAPVIPAPNGRLHIFDSYVSWQTTPKLTLAIEGDYVIERLWRNSAPGESSAPSHTDGGAAYVKYQLSPKFA